MAAFRTRDARPNDLEPVLALLPRLADYEIPPRRRAAMFWSDDAKLMRRWANGDAPGSFVRVAVDAADTPVGVAIVTMGEDPFSHEPNAHLEVIVIAETADGHGLGRRLIDEVESESRSRGARTMSLHVVGNNHRARSVYRKIGYDEELIRSIKFLDD